MTIHRNFIFYQRIPLEALSCLIGAGVGVLAAAPLRAAFMELATLTIPLPLFDALFEQIG